MNWKRWPTAAALLLAVGSACYAQVLSEPPQNAPRWADVLGGISDCWATPVDLPHNKPATIRREVLDPRLIRLMAASRRFTEQQLAGVKIAPQPGCSWINLYQVGQSEAVFNALTEDLRAYVTARHEGHSQAYLITALTNRLSLSALTDPDLRILATNVPLLAVSWARKTDSGTSTNRAGELVSQTTTLTFVNGQQVTNVTSEIPKADEVCRWVSFTVTDGEIAWNYFMRFKASGAFKYLHSSKCDARDVDPRYKPIMAEVAKEVEAQMKREGSAGQLGSCHAFWDFKKAKLKAKGIDWRSPSELNPGTNYD